MGEGAVARRIAPARPPATGTAGPSGRRPRPRRRAVTWQVHFYNERSRVLARYGVQAPTPAEALVQARSALRAEHPPRGVAPPAELARAGAAYRGPGLYGGRSIDRQGVALMESRPSMNVAASNTPSHPAGGGGSSLTPGETIAESTTHSGRLARRSAQGAEAARHDARRPLEPSNGGASAANLRGR